MMRTTPHNPAKTPTLAAFVTGDPIGPLWVSPTGRAFFPIAGGAPDDPPKDDPKKDDPPKDEPKKDDPPKFDAITSQEEFDRRLSARLAREREKYADYEDLKKAKADLDKIREESKTEQEKAVDAARKEGEASGRTASDARVVRAEAKAALATANAKNPDSAVKLLNLDGIKVGEDGEVDAEALKAKIEALKESDDYLFGTAAPGKPGKPGKPDKSQGGGGGEGATGIARGRELYAERRGSKNKAS